MLSPWLELDGVAARLDALAESSGLDLAAHGTTSDAATIRDTAVAQPLIVASSLIALRAILGDTPPWQAAGVTAGHSVGEFAAAAVAGVLTDTGAAALVSARARFMAQAAAAEATGMSAVVGGEPQEVLDAIEKAGLWAANVNGGGQIVAGGALENLAALAQEPPRRARVIPLQVAGAFHTPFMASAQEAFAPIAAGWTVSDPRMALVSNLDGQTYGSEGGFGFGRGADVVAHLTEQIAAPVRWDLSQQTFAAMGVSAIIELAPGGVLTGLAKRSLKGVESIAVTSPDDIEAAQDMVRRHATDVDA